MTMVVMKVNKIKDEDDEWNGDAEDGDNQSLTVATILIRIIAGQNNMVVLTHGTDTMIEVWNK